MSYEKDPIYQFIKNSGIPLIVRHDRSIYEKE